MSGAPRSAPLSGVRVLDFTWNLAGPYCSLQLALLGAEVIKVETASNLDGMRRGQYAIDLDPDASPTFNSVNLNKLGLRLNLKRAGGVETIEALAAVSDVLVENFRTGVLDRMGIGYEALGGGATRRSLWRRAPPSGAAGRRAPIRATPPSSTPAAAWGASPATRTGPPPSCGTPSTCASAPPLAYAVLCALWHRERTGEGQYVDHSSVEAIAALAGTAVFEHLMTGTVPTRAGNRDARAPPTVSTAAAATTGSRSRWGPTPSSARYAG